MKIKKNKYIDIRKSLDLIINFTNNFEKFKQDVGYKGYKGSGGHAQTRSRNL